MYFCGANETLSNGDKLEYGGKGEVMGPALLEAHVGKGVNVRFPGNTGNINCFVTELSRTPPPTTLAGGFEAKEQVYFSGANWTGPTGDKVEYGATKCEVVGPYTHPSGEPAVADLAVLHFPGNKGNVVCFATALSRTPPPPLADLVLSGGFRVSEHVPRVLLRQEPRAPNRPRVQFHARRAGRGDGSRLSARQGEVPDQQAGR